MCSPECLVLGQESLTWRTIQKMNLGHGCTFRGQKAACRCNEALACSFHLFFELLFFLLLLPFGLVAHRCLKCSWCSEQRMRQWWF